MNLLIITQKVDENDSVLGFFHSWIVEFAKHFENVTVICLQKGKYRLPTNVTVLSLGKEETPSRIQYIRRFFYFIFHHRKKYDVVFVHMNPEYIVLGGLLWRILNKKIALWYVHRQITAKLRIAEKLAHIIFSSTPEAFRLPSKKIHFLGHGIDFSLFPYAARAPAQNADRLFTIMHAGRITPIKNLDVLIEAAAILKESWGDNFVIKFVGAPSAANDIAYEKKLKDLVYARGLEKIIVFAGSASFVEMGRLYKEADVSVNLTPTGGMDKAVLESIASGTLVLSANRAFKDIFGMYERDLLYGERDPNDVAKKIFAIKNMSDASKNKIRDYVYERVKENFSLRNLIRRIASYITYA